VEGGKKGDRKQDGMKAYSERWKDVIYKMETGRTDFVGDWVSKDVAIRHRMTIYIHTHIGRHTSLVPSDYSGGDNWG
jgi:hypothetical protein